MLVVQILFRIFRKANVPLPHGASRELNKAYRLRFQLLSHVVKRMLDMEGLPIHAVRGRGALILDHCVSGLQSLL